MIKLKKILLESNNTYELVYTVPVNWYNNNSQVVKDMLLAYKIENIIDSNYKLKNHIVNNNNDVFTYIISSVKSKEELNKILNNKSTRIEKIYIK